MAEKIFIGRVKKDFPDCLIANENLYLEKHSWDCGHYWGFGYIGNVNLHCHFSNQLLYKFNVAEIFVNPVYSQDTWYKIQDLFKQAYALHAAAEIYRHGGWIVSDVTISKLITDDAIVQRLNDDLKTILDFLWNILLTEQEKIV